MANAIIGGLKAAGVATSDMVRDLLKSCYCLGLEGTWNVGARVHSCSALSIKVCFTSWLEPNIVILIKIGCFGSLRANSSEFGEGIRCEDH